MEFNTERILRVTRTRSRAKENYDRVSRSYDYPEGIFERKAKFSALKQLIVRNDEIFIEIGFGTGQCLRQIAGAVNSKGKVYGIDISTGMMRMAERRLKKYGLLDRVTLYCGDAMKMPFPDNYFDVVFMSFTLELFDTPEIPLLLAEIKRILKQNARIGIVSLSQEYPESLMIKLYNRAHNKYPELIDCRPIFPSLSLQEAGFKISYTGKLNIMGLPVEVVTAMMPS
jgi:ubiquinone/menaquinone biosynthesis C-methylase UbiE